MGKLGKSLKYVMGFILSMSVSIMLIGGSFSLDCFYDQGRVCDALGMDLEIPGNNMIFQDGNRYWTVVSDTADKTVYFFNAKWNYIILDIAHLNSEQAEAVLIFYRDMEEVERKEVTLSEGKNVIELDGLNFGSVLLYLEDAQGMEIGINSIQVREMPGRFSFFRFAGGTALIFFVYLIVFGIVSKWTADNRRKKDGDGSYFLKLYFEIQEKIYLHIQRGGDRFTSRQKSYIRTGIFGAVILYTTITLNVDRVVRWHPFASMFYLSVFFLLSFFSTEQKPENRNQNKPVWQIFTLFCVMICISDFFVDKKFSYVGYVFLISAGFFFYTWGKMKKPEKIFRELVWGIQVSFILYGLFCLFCRPMMPGIRYNGCFTNPNSFANYLVPVSVAWMACVEEYMKKQKPCKCVVWLLGAEGCAIGYFLWRTQSRGAMLACMIAGLLFLGRQWKMRIDLLSVKRALQLLAVLLILCIPVVEGMEWALWNLPHKLNTEVIYHGDEMTAREDGDAGSIFTVTVQASQSRVWEKMKFSTLDSFSSGRITYWKAYLREMNLWGHEYKAKVNGANHAAHNMVIEIAYRYGVVATAVFLVMWGYIFVQAWRRLGERRKFSFVASGWAASYVVLAMLDALEQPWIYIAWVLAYTVMGYWMTDGGNENDTEKRVESE